MVLPGPYCNNAVCRLDVRMPDFLLQLNDIRAKFVRKNEYGVSFSGMIYCEDMDLHNLCSVRRC